MSEANELPKLAFGATGFECTQLGFGAMELASAGGTADEPEAAKLLHRVLDLGINFIDTAPDYATSEEVIGRAISSRRDEFFLASKCGCLVDRQPRLENGKLEHDFSQANIRAGVEQSLRRMRTDHLDLVQIHSSPARRTIEEEGSVEEMLRLRDEGKVRFLGMSSTLPELEGHLAMGVFDAFQIPYSMLQPEHDQIIQKVADTGAATIIRGGVARGATAPDHDLDAAHDYWRGFALERRSLWDRADLDSILDGMPRMEFMLRFVLAHPGLHTTIVGTSKLLHLESNVAIAVRGPLGDDLVREAKRRIAAAVA